MNHLPSQRPRSSSVASGRNVRPRLHDQDDESTISAHEQISAASGRDEDSDEEPEEDELAETLTLAITTNKGSLGCAYFDNETRKLFLLEDSPEQSLDQTAHMETVGQADEEEDTWSGSGKVEGRASDLAASRALLDASNPRIASPDQMPPRHFSQLLNSSPRN